MLSRRHIRFGVCERCAQRSESLAVPNMLARGAVTRASRRLGGETCRVMSHLQWSQLSLRCRPLGQGPMARAVKATPTSHIAHFHRGADLASEEAEAVPGDRREHKKLGRRFLLAVDDSADSEYACEWALANLVQPGDEVHLVHILPALLPGRVYSLPSGKLLRVPHIDPVLLEEKAAKECDLMLSRRFTGRLAAAQVPHAVHVLTEPAPGRGRSSIGAALCTASHELGASCVVVASQTSGGLQEWLRGSVASHLTHHCQVPVVVIHKPHKEVGIPWWLAATVGAAEPHGHQAPLPNGGRRLAVAVDESNDSLNSVRWVLDHVYRAGDVLHLLHVIPLLPSTASAALAPDGMLYAAPLPSLEEATLEEAWWRDSLAARFGDLLGLRGVPFEVDVIAEFSTDPLDAVGRAVCSALSRLGASALVISSHAKGSVVEFLQGSVSQFAAHHSTVPVIVLHGSQCSPHTPQYPT